MDATGVLEAGSPSSAVADGAHRAPVGETEPLRSDIISRHGRKTNAAKLKEITVPGKMLKKKARREALQF